MINKKEREEPFHVRRVRLKQSIIKSNQMLENLSTSDNNIRKFRVVTEPICEEDQHSQIKKKQHTFNSSVVNELDLLNSKVNKSHFNHIKFAVNMQKNNRYKKAQFQMQENGLEAIRLQAKPSRKKFLTPKDYYQRNNPKQSYQQTKRTNARLIRLRNSASPDQLRKNKSVQKYTFDHSASGLQCSQTNRFTINNGITSERNIQLQKINLEPLKNKKMKLYLYQKMATNQLKQRDKSNLVYQKRIKSYTDFIWKLLLAHNVFLDLDLQSRWNQVRLKAYIGKGNNCNMIKGLIRRRFWWTISEQYTQDCNFVWSQLKIDKIYQRQEFTYQHPTILVQANPEGKLDAILSTKSSKKLPCNIFKSIKKAQRQNFNRMYSSNKKIWNQQDLQLLEKHFFEEYQKACLNESAQTDIKQANYKQSAKKIAQSSKNLTFINNIYGQDDKLENKQQEYYQVRPIVHNHLQNNFLLGNKKALFYNLKEYYQRTDEDLFSYIPLTFHIKNGFKDPEYKNFTRYYNQIKQANKQSLQKEKNIWIVKPGQNSNRGNGIVVIDQIYQFDNIIKKSQRKLKKINHQNDLSQLKPPRTFIIQKYLENPFLYYDRKFDIRHYFLMTNLYGVTRAYWYEEGYIRTSSYSYNMDSFDPEIHLTNDAVQKQYADYGKFQAFNKISYNQFQNYLNLFPEKKWNFKEQVLPQMKKIAADAAKSVYQKVSPKQQMHNFEIFGLDFMIDKKFKPWLIQINTNPCLDCQSPLLNRIIPYMVEQSLKLSLDLIYPPPSHYPSLWKHNAPLVELESFKYELIFDSLSQGEALKKLYSSHIGYKSNTADFGVIQTDQCYRDDGKEIKLQDFT